MSLDSLEAQVLAYLVAALPAAVTAENAAHTDGISIPAVVTYDRGVPPADLEVKPSSLPLVSVACLLDEVVHPRTEETAAVGDWGALFDRTVIVLGMVAGSTGAEAHVRALRLVTAVKAVLRAHVPDEMNHEVMYWPYECAVDVNPAVVLPNRQYLAVFGTEWRARVIE